jgi:hypothetical protein
MLLALESQRDSSELPQQLTEFRLHLEMAEQVLAGRPKVLRDPRVKGTLQIMPELLKFRLPPLRSERDMPERKEKQEP